MGSELTLLLSSVCENRGTKAKRRSVRRSPSQQIALGTIHDPFCPFNSTIARLSAVPTIPDHPSSPNSPGHIPFLPLLPPPFYPSTLSDLSLILSLDSHCC